jgi:hypothetical protein
MKNRHILSIGLLAGAAAALLAPPSAHAQQSISYSAGDLLLGFEKPGNSYDYIVDLGPASYFLTLSLTPGTTDITTSAHSGAGLGDIAADLSATGGSGGFGASWYNNSATQGANVQWGVIGATYGFGSTPQFGLPGNTIFETIAEPTPGQGSTAPAESSQSSQGDVVSNIEAFAGNGSFQNEESTANSNYATFQPTSSATSWTSNDPSELAFGGSGGIEQPTSGTYIGPTNSELDLYELIPTGFSGSTGTGDLLGSFTLDSSGDLDFTSAAAVPEPSAYGTIALGAAFLLFFRRTHGARKTLKA